MWPCPCLCLIVTSCFPELGHCHLRSLSGPAGRKKWEESVWTFFCWLLMPLLVPSEEPQLCHLSLEDCPAGSRLYGDSVVWGVRRWERHGYRAPCLCCSPHHRESHLGNDQIRLWETEISLLSANIWDVMDVLSKRFNCIMLSNIIAYSRLKYIWIFRGINEKTFTHYV